MRISTLLTQFYPTRLYSAKSQRGLGWTKVWTKAHTHRAVEAARGGAQRDVRAGGELQRGARALRPAALWARLAAPGAHLRGLRVRVARRGDSTG